MKALAFLGLAACLLSSPAIAGPAGTGLTFTEEVAKKNQQTRDAKPQAAIACATPKTQTTDAAPADAAVDTCRAG